MESTSRPRLTAAEWKSFRIGREIHQAVVAEGRAEGVHAYLYHAPDGRAWFEKYDPKAHKASRVFTRGLAERIKSNREHLKVYAKYYVYY